MGSTMNDLANDGTLVQVVERVNARARVHGANPGEERTGRIFFLFLLLLLLL